MQPSHSSLLCFHSDLAGGLDGEQNMTLKTWPDKHQMQIKGRTHRDSMSWNMLDRHLIGPVQHIIGCSQTGGEGITGLAGFLHWH